MKRRTLVLKIVRRQNRHAPVNQHTWQKSGVFFDCCYPIDARLYERAPAQFVDLSQEANVELRQSYVGLALRLALQVGRYAHAKQFKCMRKALKRLKGCTGHA